VADFRSQRGALTALAVALLADGGRDATTVLAASRQRFLPLRDNGPRHARSFDGRANRTDRRDRHGGRSRGGAQGAMTILAKQRRMQPRRRRAPARRTGTPWISRSTS